MGLREGEIALYFVGIEKDRREDGAAFFFSCPKLVVHLISAMNGINENVAVRKNNTSTEETGFNPLQILHMIHFCEKYNCEKYFLDSTNPKGFLFLEFSMTC